MDAFLCKTKLKVNHLRVFISIMYLFIFFRFSFPMHTSLTARFRARIKLCRGLPPLFYRVSTGDTFQRSQTELNTSTSRYKPNFQTERLKMSVLYIDTALLKWSRTCLLDLERLYLEDILPHPLFAWQSNGIIPFKFKV